MAATAAQKKKQLAAAAEKIGATVNEEGQFVLDPVAAQKALGPKKFEEMMGIAAESAAEPESFKSIALDLWGSGVKGKIVLFLSGVGFITVGSVVVEGFGAGFEIQWLRPVSAVTGFLHR